MARDHINPDHVFIVRLWKEPKHNGVVTSNWRGRVIVLETGTERYFVGLNALMGVLRKSLGIKNESEIEIEQEKAASEANS